MAESTKLNLEAANVKERERKKGEEGHMQKIFQRIHWAYPQLD